MVCAAQPLAVQAGVEILKQGGSAVDAAIAVNACLGLMEPTAERARRRPVRDRLGPEDEEARRAQRLGPRAARRSPPTRCRPTTDGTIPLYSPVLVDACRAARDGWFELHAKYGKLPMSDVLAPAIRYAEEGFPLSPVIAVGLGALGRRASRTSPASREVFMPGGRAPREGELFRNPALAKTLRAARREGPRRLLQGPDRRGDRALLARRTAASSRSRTSRSTTRPGTTPISTDYRGYDVWELPPQRPGPRRARRCSTSSRTSTSRRWAASRPDFWHVHDRGEEARLRRPRALLRRSRRSRRCRSTELLVQGLREAARGADRHEARRADRRAGRGRRRSTAARRPTCAPPTRTA